MSSIPSTLSTPCSPHSNGSTDDEQWGSTDPTPRDSAAGQSDDNQSSLQDLTDDEPRLKRRIPFRGFTSGSQEDVELLAAIEQYTPYDAQYGQKKGAWSNVIMHLRDLDADRVAKGRVPLYKSLSESACKKRWDAHQTLVRQYEATLKTATGIAPLPSAHMERMRRVVAAANACRERDDNLKSQRNRKREEFNQRHAMAEEMRRLATQRYGKRPFSAIEPPVTQESFAQDRSTRASSSRESRSTPAATAAASAASSPNAASSSSSSKSSSSNLPTTASSNSKSRSSASREGSSSPSSNALAEATVDVDRAPVSPGPSHVRALFEQEIQRHQSDSDAIARHLEAESEARRRMEDMIQKLTTSIESGHQVHLQNQQVNLQILQALKDLKNEK